MSGKSAIVKPLEMFRLLAVIVVLRINNSKYMYDIWSDSVHFFSYSIYVNKVLFSVEQL